MVQGNCCHVLLGTFHMLLQERLFESQYVFIWMNNIPFSLKRWKKWKTNGSSGALQNLNAVIEGKLKKY